jgi:DnaJ-class molecular chaperone
MDDLYKILEINENASQDDIRSAYRRLAKQHHPDLNRGDPASEDKFKKINEAHDTLGDPNKRADYDNQRKFGSQGFSGGFPGGFPGGMHFNFGMGGAPFDDLFNHVFGGGFQQPRNKDFQFAINITLYEAFTGKTMPIGFEANEQHKNISVNIPAGIEHGGKLKFAGYGDRSFGNLPPGDLYIIINIGDHPDFRRDGPHLHMQQSIDVFAAMLGDEIKFTSIDGQQVSVNVPPGTQNGAVLRVAGKGMPAHHNARTRGDLFINLSVTVPRNLSQDHKQMLETIKQQRG